MNAESEDAARERGCEREPQKFPGEQREELRLRGAHAAHHGVTVEVPLRVAPRAKRDRHRRQDDREHRGKPEEALGAVQARAHLRPRVLKAVDALAPPEARPRPLLELPDPLALTGGEQLIVDAASGLHESRRG